MISCGAITMVVAWLAAAAAPIDFDTQVMPVLSKAGCNTGACHGAALGQGGFKLSLLGQLPEDDHQAIVQELEGRRVNLARPTESLLIAKPTERVDHGGGPRIESGAAGEQILLEWLSQGAGRVQPRRLVGWEFGPKSVLLGAVEDQFTLRVTARFDTGQSEDVTPWAVITPSDPAALRVGESGQISAHRMGVHSLVLRYLDRVAAVQVIVPIGQRAVDSKALRDNEIAALLADLRIEPAPGADDATFLRRVRLDLTGRLPTPDEVRAFLADDRRSDVGLVRRLLKSPEFVDFWAHKWSRWLRIDSQRMESAGAAALYDWLREQIANDTPIDQMAGALLESEGDSHAIGPANFARATAGAREQAEHVSQLFLGARLGCANCHNHPLDRWTQDDYHGLAAIFARVERGRQVRLAPRGEVSHPRTGLAAVPRLPGKEFLESDAEGRQRLSAWLFDRENPYFARAWVNRLWGEMYGRGLVEPVDDMRDTNPATHPELLDRLAAAFADHRYSLTWLLEQIATSEAYGRAGPTAGMPVSADRYYACTPPRPLPPEVLADALCDVTGVAEDYQKPSGTRAVQLYDVRATSDSLAILGRCKRPEQCDTAAMPITLATKLHQINGPLVNAKIASAQGTLERLLASSTDEAILEELYLRAFARFPRAAEREHWLRIVGGAEQAGERRQRWQDFLWGMLSSQEFTTNH